ncbi:MAG: nucleotide exchange factor GrpE [Mycoplasmataceae bacterium]|jgi:molecular chaperone GrpE (heat shock protein)|nr:nucleotide exchange factor GrpE [Mycoplasmataceae bacterium]
MSKHESQKEETQTVNEIAKDEVETSTNETACPKCDTQSELVKLTDQIQALTVEVDAKNERILQLEEEIKTINNDYVTRVTQKADEANALLKSKLEEISNKMQQELVIHKKYALEKQAGSLIDVINQFAMALAYKPTDPNIAKYQSGFQMFLTMFKNLLSELGISEISVKIGDEFNPEFMECIEFNHSNELADNKVIKVIASGYKLYDRLIKPAMVNVVRKKS